MTKLTPSTDHPEDDGASAASEAEQATHRMRHVSLANRQSDQVKRLPGFKKKTHRIPDDVNSHTQSFVAKLGADQVREDLDRVFGELRSAFRFKRTEIQSTDWGDGAGVITTPYFRYSSSITQDPDAADESIWQRDVSEITDTNHLLSENFAEVFGSLFDTVEFNPPEPIDLEEIIDRVESIDDERIWIDYDRQITYCEVTLEGHDEKIHITRDSFRIVHPKAESPRELIDSLFRVQNRLLDFSE